MDRKFGSEVNVNWTPAAVTGNLHIGVEREHFRVEAFVMNLTDEDAPVRTRLVNGTAAIAGASVTPPTTGFYSNNVFQTMIADFIPRKPRQVGVTLTYSF